MLGEWSTNYDPLNAIKARIKGLDEAPPDWWKPRGEDLSRAARYPATESTSEWGNEILALDQLVVEGFLVKPLRALAEKLGRKIDPNWGSLKVLEECLVGMGRTPEDIKELLAPLRNLHALRNPLKAHAAGGERKKLERDARKTHGTLRAHFTALAAECEAALRQAIEILHPKEKQPTNGPSQSD